MKHDSVVTWLQIHGNDIIRTIAVTKHLSTNLKRLKALLWKDYYDSITYEEKNLMFANAAKLFSIGTISLPLDVMNAVIVNIVQIEITTNTASSVVNTIINHKDNL